MKLFSKKKKTEPETVAKPTNNDDVLNFLNDIPMFKNLPIDKIREFAKKKNLTKTLDEVLKIWNNESFQKFITEPSNLLTLASGNAAEKMKLVMKFGMANPRLSMRIGNIISKFKKLKSLLSVAGNLGIQIPNLDSKSDDESSPVKSTETVSPANTADAANAANTANGTQPATVDEKQIQINTQYGKVFDVDININKALYYLIIFIVYVMIGITVIFVAAITLYNYAMWSYLTIYEFLLTSDEINADKTYRRDLYTFKLLNYIFCVNNDIKTPKGCESQGIAYYIEYFFRVLVPLDDCDYESKVYIYGLNRLFNFCMKLFYLILVIICIQLLAYIIIYIFLGGLRNYDVKGKTMFSYLSTYGILYVYIIVLIFFYCLAHGVHFKFLFIDVVYEKLFKKYEVYRVLDKFVNEEAKSIEDQKAFLNLLFASTINNIGIGDLPDTYKHKEKLLREIKDTDSAEVYSSKVFLYTVYKYIVQHNEGKDIELIEKLNSIVQQKEGNLYTIASFLKITLDANDAKTQLNNIVQIIGQDIAEQRNTDNPTAATKATNEFTKFDFTVEERDGSKRNKLAVKLSAFLKLLESISYIEFDDIVYWLNMYIVLEWALNAVFILILLTITYFNADQSPWVKRLVIAAQALIISIIEEIQTGIIGI